MRASSVLVVEDNEEALSALAESVELLGFRAIKARDGFEATDRLADSGELHAMILDVDLPAGINGLQLARAVRLAHPHIQVILCTGLPLRSIQNYPAYEAHYRILRKPLSLNTLKEILQAPLNGRQSGP